MDKFIEIMQKMERLSPDEKEQMISKNRPLCICAKCPTYTSCMKENEELLFCFAGKSTCVADKKACICPSCPVTGSMGLTHPPVVEQHFIHDKVITPFQESPAELTSCPVYRDHVRHDLQRGVTALHLVKRRTSTREPARCRTRV